MFALRDVNQPRNPTLGCLNLDPSSVGNKTNQPNRVPGQVFVGPYGTIAGGCSCTLWNLWSIIGTYGLVQNDNIIHKLLK